MRSWRWQGLGVQSRHMGILASDLVEEIYEHHIQLREDNPRLKRLGRQHTHLRSWLGGEDVSQDLPRAGVACAGRVKEQSV